MKSFSLSGLVAITCVLAHASANGVEETVSASDAPNFFDRIREKGEDLYDKGEDLYGRVSDWVKKKQQDLSLKLQFLVKHPNEKIGKFIKTRDPVQEQGWTFELEDDVASLTVDEFIKQFTGVIPPENGGFADEADRAEAARTILLEMGVREESREADMARIIRDLPKSFDWFTKYPSCLPKSFQQGSCGSCFAVATTATASARLCGKMVDKGWTIPSDFSLAPQQMVSCVPTTVAPNGACSGGYTGKAMDWLGENNIVESECMPYVAGRGNDNRGKCNDASKCSIKWDLGTRKRLHSVGAGVGGLAAIKHELVNHGPVTVTMKTPAAFMGFNGEGVFKKEDDDPWLKSGENHSWHAVVITGYNDESDTPYFYVLNSWGSRYHGMPRGRKHFLKMDQEDSCKHLSTQVLGINVSLDNVREPTRSARRPNPVDNDRNGGGSTYRGRTQCKSPWSTGVCVPAGSCTPSNTIYNPTVMGCSNSICCKSTQRAPANKCEASYSDGKCMHVNSCGYGKRTVSGLCPGNTYIRCCTGTRSHSSGTMLPQKVAGGALVREGWVPAGTAGDAKENEVSN